MKRTAKQSPLIKSIARSVQDKRSWKGIELTGELEETGSFVEPVDTNGDEDIVALSFEELTAFRNRELPKKKENKQVVEYTLDGEYLNTYSSTMEAAKATGVMRSAIQTCCSGRSRICKSANRIFLYRGDDIEGRLSEIEASKSKYLKTGMAMAVDEYSLNGRILMVYESQKKAAEVNHLTSYKVGKCIRGEIPFVGKSVFLKHGESFKGRLPAIREQQRLDRMKRTRNRPVDVYTLEGKYLGGYPTCSEASKATGIHVSCVCRCCKGEYLSIKGKIFLYTGNSISERIELINSLKEE